MTIEQLLAGQKDNHIFPFFWQHGETEEKLREYMGVIQDCNVGAVCVESRGHKDFCGPGWWHDMDIILEEARKRRMKVWILDDSHFPTGYANGALLSAPDKLRRQSVYSRKYAVKDGQKYFRGNLERIMGKIPTTPMGSMMSRLNGNHKITFHDGRLLGVTAMVNGNPVKAEWEKDGKKLIAKIPEGAQKLYVTFLTRNAGIHRSYMNMLDKESCRVLIDAVYEKHWEHYKEDFGKTIAGFFSDEPELGNGVYFKTDTYLGQDQDLPWSREVERKLPHLLGENWIERLSLLWENEGGEGERAKVRYLYMDLITRLVEENFSRQIGSWCGEHGVEYIGHIIEDNNQHARTGASLGHYFRGLAGQHMAGIDDIGGEVLPQKEDALAEGITKITGGRDGEFYHFMLGKLGASYGAIDPVKRGRCMCEIFGNYGWSEGVRLEKYLADHFMVRGVNNFVPHAFSPKEYPDKDCPPHFYANGNNPQYRHFGKLMLYMNRICALISGGCPVVDTAIIYHGEAEWMGKCMLTQKPARALAERQVDFHIIPSDVFGERGRYQASVGRQTLTVNGNVYKTIIVPYSQFLAEALAEGLSEAEKAGCRIIFLEAYPEGTQKGMCLPSNIYRCEVMSLGELQNEVHGEAGILPESGRIRIYHYKGEEEIYYLVNEDSCPYHGMLSVPALDDCYSYDPWENQVQELSYRQEGGKTCIFLDMKAGEGKVIAVGKKERLSQAFCLPRNKKVLSGHWNYSLCRAAGYPDFSEWKELKEFGNIGEKYPGFSGFIAYECTLDKPDASRVVLEIPDAGESVEVFLNGVSAGIQVLPPFYYDITDRLTEGGNRLRIEVATTLERERKCNKKNWQPIGILKDVILWME